MACRLSFDHRGTVKNIYRVELQIIKIENMKAAK
jgi:hypothetical protein